MPYGGVPGLKDGGYRDSGPVNTSTSGSPKGDLRVAKRVAWEQDGLHVIKEINQAAYTILSTDNFLSIIYPFKCVLTLPSIATVTGAENWKGWKIIIYDKRGDAMDNNILVYRDPTTGTDLLNGVNEDYAIICGDGDSVELTAFYNQLDWGIT